MLVRRDTSGDHFSCDGRRGSGGVGRVDDVPCVRLVPVPMVMRTARMSQF